jgi:hypothetical protein
LPRAGGAILKTGPGVARGLTLRKIDRLLWLAHRRSRAAAKAKRSGFPNQSEQLERSLLAELGPHLIAILRAADRELRRRGTRYV